MFDHRFILVSDGRSEILNAFFSSLSSLVVYNYVSNIAMESHSFFYSISGNKKAI